MPMSSFQSAGWSRMKRSIIAMHSGSCMTTTSTPRERSSSSSPGNVRFSPTITFGIP
jgi:hypothetical protein